MNGDLYLFIGSRTLAIHFTPQYHEKRDKLPKRHQLLLVFGDDSSLSFTGSLGGSLFFLEAGRSGWAVEGKLPSVLSDGFTLELFLNLIKQTELRSLSMKSFLATRNRIPGLDNTILHEMLWEAGVNPKSKMAALNEKECTRIYHAIKKCFRRYTTKASKYTFGQPCARCGGLIEKEAYLGGAIYFCPRCQPFPIPVKISK